MMVAGQADAIARCCDTTYYRYSAETWKASKPWSVLMPEHCTTCYCGAELVYVESKG